MITVIDDKTWILSLLMVNVDDDIRRLKRSACCAVAISEIQGLNDDASTNNGGANHGGTTRDRLMVNKLGNHGWWLILLNRQWLTVDNHGRSSS